MSSQNPQSTVVIAVPERFVVALLNMRGILDEGFVQALEKHRGANANTAALQRHAARSPLPAHTPVGAYAAEYLGVRFTASTLPALFAKLVDATAQVAPEALDELAKMRSRRRRFVSRVREEIHRHRPDLPLLRTESGWWISRNIGRKDLERMLHALAGATGLDFGCDLKFPLE